MLDLNKKANQLEYELGRLETNLERVDDEITEIERRLEAEVDVAAQQEAVTAEIEDLRSKIERIEEGVIEQFNDHMETVLELLDYANLDRIWLEQVESVVREGRRTVTKSGVRAAHDPHHRVRRRLQGHGRPSLRA